MFDGVMKNQVTEFMFQNGRKRHRRRSHAVKKKDHKAFRRTGVSDEVKRLPGRTIPVAAFRQKDRGTVGKVEPQGLLQLTTDFPVKTWNLRGARGCR